MTSIRVQYKSSDESEEALQELHDLIWDLDTRIISGLSKSFDKVRDIYCFIRWLEREELNFNSKIRKMGFCDIPHFNMKVPLTHAFVIYISEFYKILEAPRPKMQNLKNFDKKVFRECRKKIEAEIPDLTRLRNRIAHGESIATNPIKNIAKFTSGYEEHGIKIKGGAKFLLGEGFSGNTYFRTDSDGMIEIKVDQTTVNLLFECIKMIINALINANCNVEVHDMFSEEKAMLPILSFPGSSTHIG